MATAATLPAEVTSQTPVKAASSRLRLDPRTWIVSFVSGAIWVSTTTSLPGAIVAVGLVLLAAMLQRRWYAGTGTLPWISLRWAIVAGLLTTVLYALFGPAEGPEGFRAFGLLLSYDAIRLGGLMAFRLLALLALSYLLLTSVPPLEMAAGLTRFLLPLRRIGVAVANLYYLTFFLSRMIPSLIHESKSIVLAQRSRGVGSETGQLGRWREYPARVLPVFASALRRGDSLALLLASRGFDSRRVPHRVYSLRFEPVDFAVLAAICVGWTLWLYFRMGAD